MYKIFLAAFLIITAKCGSTNEIVKCDDSLNFLSDDCVLRCKIVDLIYYYRIAIVCKSENSWENFSKVKLDLEEENPRSVVFSSAFPKGKTTQVQFYNSAFPPEFNFVNFTNTLGLEQVRSLKILKPINQLFSNISHVELDELEIEGRGNTTIPADFFKDSRIKKLRIENCSVSEQDFKFLQNLSEFNVSNNNLIRLKPNLIGHMDNLRRLDISYNQINSLSREVFKNKTQLRVLNLHNNNFQGLREKVFMDLDNLWYLDLSFNELSLLPAALLKHSKSLQLLFLNNNNLKKLPPGIFNKTDLVYLDISKNQLTHLRPEVLGGLTSLMSLDVSNNKLKHIHSDFCEYLPNIQDLYMTGNQLKSLFNYDADEEYDSSLQGPSSVFEKCNSITNLKLDANNFSIFHSDWIQSKSLAELRLEFNNISFVKIDVSSIKYDINLKSNKIIGADFNLTGLESIAEAGLIDEDIAVPLLIDIQDNNSWHCDCKIYHLLSYVQGLMQPAVYSYLQIKHENETCASPPSLKDTKLFDVDLESLDCFSV